MLSAHEAKKISEMILKEKLIYEVEKAIMEEVRKGNSRLKIFKYNDVEEKDVDLYVNLNNAEQFCSGEDEMYISKVGTDVIDILLANGYSISVQDDEIYIIWDIAKNDKIGKITIC